MNTDTSYESYDKAHINYDMTRLAVGAEQIIDFIRAHFSGTSLRILDAGCGTGSHLHCFARAGFTSLTGLDNSSTGLAAAAKKFELSNFNSTSFESAPHFVHGDVRFMPFAQNSFELILFSFVLHHLPHKTISELESLTKNVLGQARELLTPDGRLTIVSCSPEQMSPDCGCMWYYKYFPEAAKKLSARFLPPDSIRQILLDCGYCDLTIEPVANTYWTKASLDPNGPFDPAWQSGDSLFALCRQQPELFEKQLLNLRDEISSGVAQEHILKVRKRAESVKQATLLIAKKA